MVGLARAGRYTHTLMIEVSRHSVRLTGLCGLSLVMAVGGVLGAKAQAVELARETAAAKQRAENADRDKKDESGDEKSKLSIEPVCDLWDRTGPRAGAGSRDGEYTGQIGSAPRCRELFPTQESAGTVVVAREQGHFIKRDLREGNWAHGPPVWNQT